MYEIPTTNNKMRFLQPIGILHNNNDNPNKRHSTYATTNGNNHQLVTIIQQNDLSEQTTTSYIDDDHPNVTIRNNSVAFTKNQFNQNNREKYKVVSNGHYVNEVDNLIRETNQTTNGFNGNESSTVIDNITFKRQHNNLNEHSQTKNNLNQTFNNINSHHYNAITNGIACRENLTKLDLDTNIQHHIITRGGDWGSSICSESSPDDSFMDDEGPEIQQ
ncbi:hypothetical protein Bhyg_01419 [Pseudolycoriella hygida]|uniref:Uncharacterized protein n=1 Tax=Pseudolycoriella hygida TaxID=35572 RepID=A0A9Q0S6U4_9DIPT|nr:hypothetical protein Bhyg_01419 [Pseudolycoriella hygida]